MPLFQSNRTQTPPKKVALPWIHIRRDDVFIVSYPKSGNTWVRFLLANLLAPTETISFRNIENYVPDIYKSAATLGRRTGRRYIKSHHPCYDLYPKFIYIYRDGRDSLVSYYHYATGKKVFAGTFADFLFSSFATKFSSWSEHVSDACDFATKYPDRILVLQYERLLENPSPGANSISTFLELGCDHQALARAVKATSFDRLKAMEENSGAENPAKPVTFFRSGRSGQWREYFSAKLYERFCSENGATLLRLGYEL